MMETSLHHSVDLETILFEQHGIKETDMLTEVKDEIEDIACEVVDENYTQVMNETPEEDIMEFDDDGDSIPVIEVLDLDPLEESDEYDYENKLDVETENSSTSHLCDIKFLESISEVSNEDNKEKVDVEVIVERDCFELSDKDEISNPAVIFCTACKKTFDNKGFLEDHCMCKGLVKLCSSCEFESLDNYPRANSYKCYKCGKEFRSQALLLAHSKYNFYSCSYCKKCVKTLKALKSHQYYCRRKFFKENQPISKEAFVMFCPACKKVFDNKGPLEDHCVCKGLDNLCSSCGFISLDNHLSAYKSVYKCHKCGWKFRSQAMLLAHTKYNFYSCSYCKKCVTTLKALKSHQYYCKKKIFKENQQISKEAFGNDIKMTCPACKVVFPTLLAKILHCKCVGRSLRCKQCTTKKTIKSIIPLRKQAPYQLNNANSFSLLKKLDDVLASCSACKVVFPTLKQMKAHCVCLGTRFPCAFCTRDGTILEENFSEEFPLLTNLNNNENNVSYKQRADLLISCRACKRFFEGRSDLQIHCECLGRFKSCNTCSSNGKTEHTKSSQPIQYRCEQCIKTFSRYSLLVAHEKCHKMQNHSCNVCGKEFQLKRSLRRHEALGVCKKEVEMGCEIQNDSELHVCNTCEVSFTHPEFLKTHCSCCGQDICIECFPPEENRSTDKVKENLEYSEGSPSSNALDSSDLMNYVICKICGDYLVDDNALLIHEKKHKYKHICLKCRKRFSTVGLLKGHQKKFKCKSKGQNNVCEEYDPNHYKINKFHRCGGCGYQIDNKAGLIKHLFSHSDKLQFKCSVCGKGFKHKWSRTRHMFLHTGLKPYICKICNASFADLGNCKAHQKCHLGIMREYKCSLCTLTFPSRYMYRRHRRDVHS